MMTPIVLFDLYDTLLRERSFDFGRGLDMLYETGFHTVCSREELAAYAAAFLPAYEARKTGHTEIAFIQKDYPAYCRRFGFRLPLPDEEVEYAVLSRMEEVEPEDGVEDALGVLAGRGVRMYVLTNSIFLAPSQERLLREHGIARFFEAVFASADIGRRKPARAFFEYGIGRVLRDNPGASRRDLVFVGNDLAADIRGGLAVGLRTVWYNAAGRPAPPGLPAAVIRSMRELPGIL